MSAYLNGALVGTAAYAPVGSGWSTSHIGQQPGGGRNFPGLIDEVRAYSRSLTASEAQRIYAEGARRVQLAGTP
jgi:hypothetical protein